MDITSLDLIYDSEDDIILELFNMDLIPSIVLKKGKEEFRISQLSDGEKLLLLLMVFNIVKEQCYTNFSEKSEKLSSEKILNSPGIVLIDEIELHLHPKW